jgi:hypothetical protein
VVVSEEHPFVRCLQTAAVEVLGHCPPLGAFGVETAEQITELAKLGATLVYTYSADRGRQQLDPASPMGKAIADHQMKVMYNLSSRFVGLVLAKELT